jgi:hypothetical protein
MKQKIEFWPAFWASGILVSLTFAGDILFGLMFPNWWVMQFFWEQILPGYEFISVGSFFLGLIESFASGAYLALVFVPLYNLFLSRSS